MTLLVTIIGFYSDFRMDNILFVESMGNALLIIIIGIAVK